MHIRMCAFERKIAATFNDAPVAATSVVLLQVRTENSSKPHSGRPESKKPDNGVQLIDTQVYLYCGQRASTIFACRKTTSDRSAAGSARYYWPITHGDLCAPRTRAES